MSGKNKYKQYKINYEILKSNIYTNNDNIMIDQYGGGTRILYENKESETSRHIVIKQIEPFFRESYRELYINGILVLSTSDNKNYHEMLVHVPLIHNPNIENVLIIGGGNGGCIKQLCRYRTIKNIHLLDEDNDVINACSIYLSSVSGLALYNSDYRIDESDESMYTRDSRIVTYVGDIFTEIDKLNKDFYDLIIIDFMEENTENVNYLKFLINLNSYLRTNGILVKSLPEYKSELKFNHKDSYWTFVKSLGGFREFLFCSNVYSLKTPPNWNDWYKLRINNLSYFYRGNYEIGLSKPQPRPLLSDRALESMWEAT